MCVVYVPVQITAKMLLETIVFLVLNDEKKSKEKKINIGLIIREFLDKSLYVRGIDL